MSNDDLRAEIAKLKFHVRMLGRALPTESHSVESMVVSFDWSEEDLDAVHDIFEEYDGKLNGGEDIKWMEFEHKLRERFGIGYQRVKIIVLAFYDSQQWTQVCRGYAMHFEPATPVEFHRITRQENDL